MEAGVNITPVDKVSRIKGLGFGRDIRELNSFVIDRIRLVVEALNGNGAVDVAGHRALGGASTGFSCFDLIDSGNASGKGPLEITKRVGAYAQILTKIILDMYAQEITQRARARQLHIAM